MFLTSLAKEHYEPWLRQRGEDSQQVELPYTYLLIDTRRHRVLVDTGVGVDRSKPNQGKLLPLLRAEGIEPHEIDTVVLSHGHSDHVGGCLNEAGQPAFRNARYVMFRKERDYWMSNPSLAELPVDGSFKKGMLASAQKKLGRDSSTTRSRGSGYGDRTRDRGHCGVRALARPDGTRDFVG
jgi:glyoxylase-like metal-dependent hydrolase (beta-lactamase superfamily II)